MEKKLIHGNELKGAKHGMEDNMIRQTSVYTGTCMWVPNKVANLTSKDVEVL